VGDISEYIFCESGLVHTITLFMESATARNVMFNSNLRIHQDYDFVLRAYKNGSSFNMINEVLAIWHNEKRKDRMGSSKDYLSSYNWMESNQSLFTVKSKKGFI
jgi:hypothetical protein